MNLSFETQVVNTNFKAIEPFKMRDEATNSSSTLFSINSDNEDFAARQRNIFAQLNVAEVNRINEQSTAGAESDSNNSSGGEDAEPTHPTPQKSITSHFRGRKSIFKTPSLPLKKSLAASRIPDYRKNPHKWTKYSLEDVDTSERSNTAGALSFLKEIESRKAQNEMENDDGGGEKKIVFQRSVTVKNKLDDGREEEKLRFRSSKVVMPEYVVGQKIKNLKNKKKGTKANSASKELRLDHLMEEEDEDGVN